MTKEINGLFHDSYCFKVTIVDAKGSVLVTCFSPEADSLIPSTVHDLLSYTPDPNPYVLPSLIQKECGDRRIITYSLSISLWSILFLMGLHMLVCLQELWNKSKNWLCTVVLSLNGLRITLFRITGWSFLCCIWCKPSISLMNVEQLMWRLQAPWTQEVVLSSSKLIDL